MIGGAAILVHGVHAGELHEVQAGQFAFVYDPAYRGPPVSLTMPVAGGRYDFAGFPPFFDGVLPEGPQLEALLRHGKLDRDDLLGQLLYVGGDLVGAVTALPLPSS